MECRADCGACCIAPSINTPFHGMPRGKPAGVRCVHLDQQMRCRLFGDRRRPAFCGQYAAEEDLCGTNRAEALALLHWLERESAPEYPVAATIDRTERRPS